MNDDERDSFQRWIISQLSEHPEWTAAAVQAVMAGAERAMDTMKQRFAEKDAAFLAALALLETKRLTPEVKESLNRVISRGLADERNR